MVEADAVAAARVAAVPQALLVPVQVPRVRALQALPVLARTRRPAEVVEVDVVPRRQQALNHHRSRPLRLQTMGAGSIAARTTA